MTSAALTALALAVASGWCVLRAVRPGAPAARPAGPVPGLIRMGLRVPVPAGLIARGGAASPAVLAAAGLDDAMGPDDLARARWGLTLAAALPAVPLLVAGPAGAVAGVALAGLAWMAPGRVVAARAADRRRRIGAQLPDLLELLGVCVESGMALDPALRIVSDRLAGPLGAELRRLLEDMATGTPRAAAYRTMAARIGLPALDQAVGALLQADELGAPLSPALRSQAVAMRELRRREALDRAARAAPKIQLVVAMLMVPAVMLLVVAVMAIELARQLGPVLGGLR